MDESSKPESFGEAEYALESPVKCPACGEMLHGLAVVRLLRARVNFISTLPRRGYVLACPHCRSLLGGELGGLT